MTPLETTQQVLMWLCIVPLDNLNARKKRKILNIVFSLTVGLLLIAQLIASATFCRKHISTDLQISLYAIHQLLAWFPMLYIFIIVFLSRREITAILIELSNIYDTSN